MLVCKPLAPFDRTVVLGIGNPLMSDDGWGIHVIHHLQALPGNPSWPEGQIDLIDGGTLGYLLLERLEGVAGLLMSASLFMLSGISQRLRQCIRLTA